MFCFWLIFALRWPQKPKHYIPQQPKSQPTHPFFKSEAISNMWFVRIYCCLYGLLPLHFSPAPVVGLLRPWVLALKPKTHTSSLPRCFPLLPQLSHLRSLSFAWLFNRPFCSASFLFQTNSGNFLSLFFVFWEETFSVCGERTADHKRLITCQISTSCTCLHSCVCQK